MPIVRVDVDQATFDKLVEMRKKHGASSIAALLLMMTVGRLDDVEIEVGEIVRLAMTSLNARQKGDVFVLRDLFPRDQWEGFSKSARLRAGRSFNARVVAGSDDVHIHGKSSSHHQLYIRR